MFLNGTLHCNLCCKSWLQASVKFRNGDAIKQFSASGGAGEKKSHILLYFTPFSLTNGILKLDRCPQWSRAQKSEGTGELQRACFFFVYYLNSIIQKMH